MSQITQDDIKWNANKVFCRKKSQMQIRSDRTGRIAEKNILYGLSRNCRRIRQRLKDIVLQCFMRERSNDMTRDADQNNKMRRYRKFKTIENYKCGYYLRQVTDTRHRITLTKLRLSNHELAIETGRYLRPVKKPEERICPMFKLEMEDEYHFLTVCPAYQEKRNVVFDNVKNEHLIRGNKISPNEILMFLINPPKDQPEIQKLKVKYVFEYFKISNKKEEKGDQICVCVCNHRYLYQLVM